MPLPRICSQCEFHSYHTKRCGVEKLNPSTKERMIDIALNLGFDKICKYNKFKIEQLEENKIEL